MTNLMSTLRDEIARLARKEVKRRLAPAQRKLAVYRKEILLLKRNVRDLERKLGTTSTASASAESDSTENGEDGSMTGLRFSARSVKAQRRRLKLTAAEFGKLLGVSAQTVYLWERGVTRPGRKHFASLVAARSLSRGEAEERLTG